MDTLVLVFLQYLMQKNPAREEHQSVQNSLESLGKRLRSRSKAQGDHGHPWDEFVTSIDLDWSPLLTINESAMQTGGIDQIYDGTPYSVC